MSLFNSIIEQTVDEKLADLEYLTKLLEQTRTNRLNNSRQYFEFIDIDVFIYLLQKNIEQKRRYSIGQLSKNYHHVSVTRLLNYAKGKELLNNYLDWHDYRERNEFKAFSDSSINGIKFHSYVEHYLTGDTKTFSSYGKYNQFVDPLINECILTIINRSNEMLGNPIIKKNKNMSLRAWYPELKSQHNISFHPEYDLNRGIIHGRADLIIKHGNRTIFIDWKVQHVEKDAYLDDNIFLNKPFEFALNTKSSLTKLQLSLYASLYSQNMRSIDFDIISVYIKTADSNISKRINTVPDFTEKFEIVYYDKEYYYALKKSGI